MASPLAPRRGPVELGDEVVQQLSDRPGICDSGAADFVRVLALGYAGAQLGTRFIATTECRAHPEYKDAILRAREEDIVHTERMTGVPVAVIRTPYVARIGTRVGPVARMLFRGRKTKHWMRTFYNLRSLWQLKRSSLPEATRRDYWQAGKSVATIDAVEPAGEVVRRFADALRAARRQSSVV